MPTFVIGQIVEVLVDDAWTPGRIEAVVIDKETTHMVARYRCEPDGVEHETTMHVADIRPLQGLPDSQAWRRAIALALRETYAETDDAAWQLMLRYEESGRAELWDSQVLAVDAAVFRTLGFHLPETAQVLKRFAEENTAAVHANDHAKQREIHRHVQALLALCAGVETDIVQELTHQMRPCDLWHWIELGATVNYEPDRVDDGAPRPEVLLSV